MQMALMWLKIFRAIFFLSHTKNNNQTSKTDKIPNIQTTHFSLHKTNRHSQGFGLNSSEIGNAADNPSPREDAFLEKRK